MYLPTILLLLQLTFIKSARILVLTQTPSLSHNIFYRPIIKELLKNQHEIVAITTDPMNDPELENITEISIHDGAYAAMDIGKLLIEHNKAPSQIKFLNYMIPCILETTEHALKEVVKLKDQKFDLVVVEFLMVTANHHLGKYFNCPMIGMVSMELTTAGNDALGMPVNPSYFVEWFRPSGTNLSFRQRLVNFIYLNGYRLFYRYIYMPKQEELAKKYFSDRDGKIDLAESESSIDLVLVNTNPIFFRAKPTVPNLIPLNGLQIQQPKPLPKDLKKILNSATEGVVYISFGSNIKIALLGEEIMSEILTACSKLPYQFFWKWEINSTQKVPANVHFRKWFPQQDLLGHPNVKLFITQGGIQSIEEAIYFEVPLLSIPFGSDQQSNADRIDELGIGKQIKLDEITADALVGGITEIITNETYQKEISKVAYLIWDQPSEPLERAVWWIEYVLRHGGAQHLQSVTAKVPLLIQLNLDIYFTIILVFILILITVYYLIKMIINRFRFCKKSKLQKTKLQ